MTQLQYQTAPVRDDDHEWIDVGEQFAAPLPARSEVRWHRFGLTGPVDSAIVVLTVRRSGPADGEA